MPELPDITHYVEAIGARVTGQPLESVRLASPFLLRTVDPPLEEAFGKAVRGIRRIGKRIVFEIDGGLFLVVHLMIAGRFHWKELGARIPGKIGLAAFDVPAGTLVLTEAGTKKRASLHVVRGEEQLRQFDKGGVELFDATAEEFRSALMRENHTLKRALTDPRLFSGIGNAYSDEILHRAKLSPLKLTSKLTSMEAEQLHAAAKETMAEWTERLRTEAHGAFPEKVTAFRPEMAVHGKFGKPCPVCGTSVQRIVYSENECNYCPLCQTGGKILADRSLSRLLKDDWPTSIDDLQED